MAQSYNINSVSTTTKTWESKYGKMVTYFLRLEGYEGEVQINKKEGSEAPKAGESIFGEIVEDSYGAKFKSQKNPSGFKGTPRDQNAIRAQWAIGQAHLAIPYDPSDEEKWIRNVGKTAKLFYAMVERVKDD